MRKVREILRLHFDKGLSNRAVARAVEASASTVSDCLSRAKVVGLGWPLPEGLDDGVRTTATSTASSAVKYTPTATGTCVQP